jgi:hypothetical protein
MGTFVPDRTVLPLTDKAFGGTIGRTLAHSVPDWSFIPGARAPEGAPNELVVLVDDAGFGSIGVRNCRTRQSCGSKPISRARSIASPRLWAPSFR